MQRGSCPFSTLNLKLGAVTKGLQAWSNRKVGHAQSQLAMAQEILHRREIAQDSWSLSQEELGLKSVLKKCSLMLSSLKRTIAHLRSRISSLKEGDANTKFFHMQARHQKRKNFIVRLESKEGIYTNHEDKTKVIDDFYENLLGTSYNGKHSIDLQALGVPSHNLAALDSPFSEKEVWETLKQMPSDKE
jgi:hypothetical protein